MLKSRRNKDIGEVNVKGQKKIQVDSKTGLKELPSGSTPCEAKGLIFYHVQG